MLVSSGTRRSITRKYTSRRLGRRRRKYDE
jgi:hypothetical protein